MNCNNFIYNLLVNRKKFKPDMYLRELEFIHGLKDCENIKHIKYMRNEYKKELDKEYDDITTNYICNKDSLFKVNILTKINYKRDMIYLWLDLNLINKIYGFPSLYLSRIT